jgi:hypothetical protein
MATPIDNLIANVGDVMALFEIHEKHGGNRAGRRYGMEVLNKSAIVLTTACWEAFVEDLSLAGSTFIAKKLKSADRLPEVIKKPICKAVKDDKHELSPWSLAGSGWRSELVASVERRLKGFNSPKVDQVEKLVTCAIGLSDISSHWHWRNTSSVDARTKLDELVTLRGEIAHRVSAGTAVHKTTARGYAEFIQRLAVCTSNAAKDYLDALTGSSPWGRAIITSD